MSGVIGFVTVGRRGDWKMWGEVANDCPATTPQCVEGHASEVVDDPAALPFCCPSSCCPPPRTIPRPRWAHLTKPEHDADRGAKAGGSGIAARGAGGVHMRGAVVVNSSIVTKRYDATAAAHGERRRRGGLRGGQARPLQLVLQADHARFGKLGRGFGRVRPAACLRVDRLKAQRSVPTFVLLPPPVKGERRA